MPHASFEGLRVLSLESRRAREIEKLIRTYNGEPFVVPAMREIPLSSNTACLEFGAGLLEDEFDVVLFLTGVGVRAMMTVLEGQFPREEILAALRRTAIVARGVKPQAALRELELPMAAVAPEPTTWREVMATLDATFGPRLGGMRLAVQEYGATNPEMLSALVERCASVTKVPVYQWGLPEDLGPLRETVLAAVHGGVDVVLFLTAVQVIHLFQVAGDMGLAEDLRRGLEATVVVSVGPTTTEELQHYGVRPDFQPSRPKMGFMVNEAAQYAGKLLRTKRTPVPPLELLGASLELAGASLDLAGASRELPGGPSERGDLTESGVGGRFVPAGQASGKTAPAGVPQVAPSTATMAGFLDGLAPLDILHDISQGFAASDPLHLVLGRIVSFVSAMIPCDSCFLYTVEGKDLVLRASRNPHSDVVDNFRIQLGEGVTGWVAEHREAVAIPERASEDPRFMPFRTLPEDRFEAMLCVPILCAHRVVGVLNVQHRERYVHTDIQRRLLSTIGILVGAEMERARLETENSELVQRLETRKMVDRAKGLLQRDLGISEEDAYRSMQRESRQRRRSMREIAEAVLLAESLRTGPRAEAS